MLFSRPLTKLFLGLAASAAVLSGCDRQKAAEGQAASTGQEPAAVIDRSHKGAKMPELLFKNAAGKELSLSSLAGKPTLINLWATWCAPCIAELPKLEALAQKKGAGLQIVTISQDMTGGEKVAGFLAAHGAASLPAWLDADNTAATQYQVSSLPMTIYYDAQGREKWRMSGGHDWSSRETEKLLGE